MLALAGANGVGVVLFGVLYVTAGLDMLSQAAFLGCLAVLIALVTALWVRTESRHRALGFVRRVGRAAFGLAAVVLVTPPLVLMPVFWLDSILPPEAGAAWLPGRVMVVVFIALGLVALTNVVGVLAIVVGTLRGRRPRGTA
jgi:hypothetical protein